MGGASTGRPQARLLPFAVYMLHTMTPGITYILPIRTRVASTAMEFVRYLQWISDRAEVIVVDGSAPAVFREHALAWGRFVRHIQPHADLITDMGKVGGVLTGVRMASFERLVIADDDVRYDESSLTAVSAALENAHVVRPQNYFDPLPWHARWDTGRMLLNRVFGGDWPGTVGVRRSTLVGTGGYDGSVMFENLELVRTVKAYGGTEAVLPGVYVKRIPSTDFHFWSQRVRQAYDEFARPLRLTIQLLVLPAFLLAVATEHWGLLAGAVLAIVALAEYGRRLAGGRKYFPASAALFAPLWVGERAICSWLAMGSRLRYGGVRYNGVVLRHAATPMHVLRERQARRRQRAAAITPDQRAESRSA